MALAVSTAVNSFWESAAKRSQPRNVAIEENDDFRDVFVQSPARPKAHHGDAKHRHAPRAFSCRRDHQLIRERS
jgi:hypothetical protein